MNSRNILIGYTNNAAIYNKNSIGEDNKSSEMRVKQIQSKDFFEKVRSNFIFKKIFQCMKKNKTLEIIKYNKRLQKRLILNINDYKEYYQSIEIELKIVDNEYKYGEFINISDEDKQHYHIYFNNSNKEIKRNYLNKNEKVKNIRIIIDYQIKSFKKLFYNYK